MPSLTPQWNTGCISTFKGIHLYANEVLNATNRVSGLDYVNHVTQAHPIQNKYTVYGLNGFDTSWNLWTSFRIYIHPNPMKIITT